MVKKVDTAVVTLWGNMVGAVSWLEDRGYAVFEYDPVFLRQGLDISPIHMGLNEARKGKGLFSFASLNKQTYLGLPGLLADSLPDKFGNNLIDAWLARQGRDGSRFSPVERLCYMGKRSMGALEFSPSLIEKSDKSLPIEISALVELTQELMRRHTHLNVAINNHTEKENADALLDILRVGTSAGGARPKAVIAMNEQGHVVSGQTTAPAGYSYWVLKFDGVTDMELGETKDYGRIEYAYSLMAKAAGITMTECRLLEENGRAHFMTKRFDRVKGKKIHMQSLSGIAHYDFNMAGAYSYEQAFAVMRKLRLSKADAIQQYRRMVFNVIARNQDDHTRNISFLMTADGNWALSPAYDVIYSHNPKGVWTSQHQMTLAGKRDHFTLRDLLEVGQSISLSKAESIIDEIKSVVAKWPDFAHEAGVQIKHANEIANNHRLNIR